jgi:hypothetical protein
MQPSPATYSLFVPHHPTSVCYAVPPLDVIPSHSSPLQVPLPSPSAFPVVAPEVDRMSLFAQIGMCGARVADLCCQAKRNGTAIESHNMDELEILCFAITHRLQYLIGHKQYHNLLAAENSSALPSASPSSQTAGYAVNKQPHLTTKKRTNAQDSPSGSTPTKKRKGSDPGRRCLDCNRDVTNQWRSGPEGPSTLCNACGMRWSRAEAKKNGTQPKGKKLRTKRTGLSCRCRERAPSWLLL